MVDDSIELRILKNRQAALQAINGDLGGYAYTVSSPSQVSLDPTLNLLTMNNVDLPFMVLEPTADGNREFYPAMQLKDIFRVNIHARVDADTADQAARAKAWTDLGADIEKALAVDITCDGLAYDCRVLPHQPFVGVGSPIVILVVPMEIRLHRAYGVAR